MPNNGPVSLDASTEASGGNGTVPIDTRLKSMALLRCFRGGADLSLVPTLVLAFSPSIQKNRAIPPMAASTPRTARRDTRSP